MISDYGVSRTLGLPSSAPCRGRWSRSCGRSLSTRGKQRWVFFALAAAWHKANDAARMRFAEFAGRWEPGVPDPNWRMLDNVGIGDGHVEG